ncbi:hypothetical protein SDC9_49297 [bioreactor metagenome]|uniref:Uncharacterized protein n=1 Tax=bioreactor metagenome TaxID=1076179 RepID=A0A644WHQ4_9ZZZZ
MTGSCMKKPLIVVDFKKYRIRIHKNTLLSLGSPEYIFLLVNPKERTLAILRSDRFNPRAHRISAVLLQSGKPIELYSRSLVKILCDVCNDWQDHKSYRLYGDIIPNEGIVHFYMPDALPVKGVKL